jgi:hypothetical protein
MEPSIDQLMKRYRNMSDEEIEHLAYYQAKTLTPEALKILEGEIKRRSLTQDFQAIVDIQEKGLTDEELNELTDAISALPCPICFSKEKRLNASKIAIAKSAILVTTIDDPLLIACPDCIISSAKSATKKTLLLGWWAIPWGPIRTFQALSTNSTSKNYERYNKPTPEFVEFIKTNAPAIKAKMICWKSSCY